MSTTLEDLAWQCGCGMRHPVPFQWCPDCGDENPDFATKPSQLFPRTRCAGVVLTPKREETDDGS